MVFLHAPLSRYQKTKVGNIVDGNSAWYFAEYARPRTNSPSLRATDKSYKGGRRRACRRQSVLQSKKTGW